MARYILVALVVLSVVYGSQCLKDDDCEGEKESSMFGTSYDNKPKSISISVCIKTVQRFSDSLDSSVKSDPKKIEEEFKKYCKTSKNKEHRFVSVAN